MRNNLLFGVGASVYTPLPGVTFPEPYCTLVSFRSTLSVQEREGERKERERERGGSATSSLFLSVGFLRPSFD